MFVPHHIPYECWISCQLGHTSPPQSRGNLSPSHLPVCLLLCTMSPTPLPAFQAINSLLRGSSLFMGRELPDDARGHSQGDILLWPQKVTIKDQHTGSFLKYIPNPICKIKYTKLTQRPIFLPEREKSSLTPHHIPIPSALQYWILSVG